MIDVHCHLLAGIDDGPDTLKEAIELAQAAVGDGITHAIATPHIHNGRWNNDLDSILNAWQALTCAIQKHRIPLQLAVAAELRLDAELPDMIDHHRVPFLGNWYEKKVLLLEMPHGEVPPGTDKVLAWLKKRGIIAMIAHPERNRAVMKKPSKLQPLLEQGCLFQVTAASLIGDFGEGAHRIALGLLNEELITVLASDAHNTKNRPHKLSAGYEFVKAKKGNQLANQLVYSNPKQLFTTNSVVLVDGEINVIHN